MELKTEKFAIGENQPVYFIADIASNHCGDLEKAKELVHACAEAGAHAAKFQNFTAAGLVSDYGFKHLPKMGSTHQDKWEKSVFESYDEASVPLMWTRVLKEECDKAGIDYFTSPYSPELLEQTLPYLCAIKLGSGDLTHHKEIELMCKTPLPVLIATGASDMEEVRLAMEVARRNTDKLVLMQCNTNYTAELEEDQDATYERFKNINLKVLETYRKEFPGVLLGLSDHTHGDTTVLGACGIFGACAVEKHFTFDNTLKGQDHPFSMTGESWRRMVDRANELMEKVRGVESYEERYRLTEEMVDDKRALRFSIGTGVKRVEENEKDSRVVQRRGVRSTRKLKAGEVIKEEDLVSLRPCPPEGLPPYKEPELVGRTVATDIEEGDIVTFERVK